MKIFLKNANGPHLPCLQNSWILHPSNLPSYRLTSRICIRHSQLCDVSSRSPQCCCIVVVFLFGGLTMALEVGILVDILSHFVPFPIFAQTNWSAATPFHILLFHPQYAFVTVCSSSGPREVGRRSVRCSSVGWCCLPAGMLLVQRAQGVTTPWNGCSLSKFNTFEVKDWLEATPFSEYS